MRNAADPGGHARSPGGMTLDAELPLPGSDRSRRWRLALTGIVLFASGYACGAAATRPRPEQKPLASWSGLLERVANRMQRDLRLTGPQRDRIEDTVRTHQPELDRIRSRTLRETRSELLQVIEEMAAVLTDEQAVRFRAEVRPRLDLHFPPGVGAPSTEPPGK